MKRAQSKILYQQFMQSLNHHFGELRKMNSDLHVVDKLLYDYEGKSLSRNYENWPDEEAVRAEAKIVVKAMEQFEKQLKEYKEAFDREMTIVGKPRRSYYGRVNWGEIIDETRKARSAPSSPEPEKKKRRQCE
ncbi:hypothetical protein COOONC_06934 [Cooperia oncophora]